MGIFPQGQGNQGIVRRRTQLYAAQAIPMIDTEIAEKCHLRKKAIYGWKQTGGFLSIHGLASSSWAASRKRVASSPKRPIK